MVASACASISTIAVKSLGHPPCGSPLADPMLRVTQQEIQTMLAKCNKLHPPSKPTGAGGGGFGANGGVGGDLSGNPFGSVDSGGGGLSTWVCSQLDGVGPVGCAWQYHPVM